MRSLGGFVLIVAMFVSSPNVAFAQNNTEPHAALAERYELGLAQLAEKSPTASGLLEIYHQYACLTIPDKHGKFVPVKKIDGDTFIPVQAYTTTDEVNLYYDSTPMGIQLFPDHSNPVVCGLHLADYLAQCHDSIILGIPVPPKRTTRFARWMAEHETIQYRILDEYTNGAWSDMVAKRRDAIEHEEWFLTHPDDFHFGGTKGDEERLTTLFGQLSPGNETEMIWFLSDASNLMLAHRLATTPDQFDRVITKRYRQQNEAGGVYEEWKP